MNPAEPFLPHLTLLLGGARSGKSALAQRMAQECAGRVLYLATAEALDGEMAQRIAAHRASRPAEWQTLEAPRRLADALRPLQGSYDFGVLDCVTLLASNVIGGLAEDTPAAQAEAALMSEVEDLLAALRASGARWVLVSNEVGLGLVPPYPLGRTYRDALGRANQFLAAQADSVLFLVSGLPLTLK